MNKTIKDVEWKSQQIWHSLIVMKANSWDKWDNDTKIIYNECRRLLSFVQQAIKSRESAASIQNRMREYNTAMNNLLWKIDESN